MGVKAMSVFDESLDSVNLCVGSWSFSKESVK